MVCDNKIFRVEKFISLKEKFNNYFVNLEFEKLNKIVSKPFGEFGMPRIYIKTIASLEDFLNESLQKEKEAKEAKKKMNTTQAKALNSMKNKIKKIVRQYEEEIEKWRQVSTFFIKKRKINYKFLICIICIKIEPDTYRG